MGRIDRYVLSQLTVLFGFFSLVLILVYWINRAVVLFDQLIADGQSAAVFLEFSVLSLPAIVQIALPLSAFFGTLYVTNRLTSDSELTVMHATGHSSWRLARPVLFFGIAASALMALLAHALVPLAADRLAERQIDISREFTARILDEGTFQDPATGITLYIRDITPEGELIDVLLSDTRSDSETVTYTAARAYLVRTERGPQIVMRDGMAQTLRAESQSLIVTSFDDFTYDVASFIATDSQRRRRVAHVPSWEMLSPTDALTEETRRSASALFAEVHERMARALQPIAAALIGFATLLVGGFSRFGVWRQIFVAVLLIASVKMVESATIDLAQSSAGMWWAMYLPILYGIAVAVALLWMADRPFRRRAGAAA